ncbi:MAG TPA: hypothetical protein VG079_07960, partial [Gaiellaceae bacterium]|nr:hypothetical protein [Gaiellaceae bacterium]
MLRERRAQSARRSGRAGAGARALGALLGTGEAASAPARRGVKDYARALVSTAGDRWTADLAVLGVLLTLTAVFGRAFSKLHVPGTPLYVTEIALAIVTVLAVRRYGLSRSVARIRATVPVIPLLVFWLAGAIATVRGLGEFGFSGVLQDIGLAEYSVVLPLVALVVDSRARARQLADILVYAGLAATLVFGLVFFFAPTSPIGPEAYPNSAATIYLALLVLLVAARWGHRLRPPAAHVVAAVAATVLILLTVVRSALLALPTALLALVVQLPRDRRLIGGIVAGGALVAAGAAALAVQNTGVGWRPAAQLVATAAASPHFVADDSSTAFVGGRSVTGDASSGNASRELALQETFEVTALSGLVPGETYTVIFSVRPLQPARTKGFVGDTSGSGWASKSWTVTRRLRWQSVQRTLTATAATERLVVWPTAGAARVRVDGVAVLKGGVLARAAEPPRPASPGALARAGETRPASGEAVRVAPDDSGGGVPIIADVRHAFSGSVASGSSANV